MYYGHENNVLDKNISYSWPASSLFEFVIVTILYQMPWGRARGGVAFHLLRMRQHDAFSPVSFSARVNQVSSVIFSVSILWGKFAEVLGNKKKAIMQILARAVL